MKKEIRKDVRDYILSEVNVLLSRLGVNEGVKETGEKYWKNSDKLDYNFKSAPVRQTPMLFKKLYVEGYMVSVDIKDDKDRFYGWTDENDIIVVRLEYSWESFSRGSNGTDIGRLVYAVSKELPETFESKYRSVEETAGMYVTKLEGIEI